MASSAVDPAATKPSGATGLIEVGGRSYLLGGANAAAFPTADGRPGGLDAPAFDGDVAAYVAAGNDETQLYNQVKKCDSCGKVCAVSMDVCNGCGTSIADVAPSRSNNVFVGFIHGVAKGPFPFKISLRLESPSMLAFDDPLSITRCHLCSIPTNVYIPDMRTLFTNPPAGLTMMRQLSDAAWEATTTQFLNDTEWSTKALSPAALALGPDGMRAHVISGLNYPPSQYQLHLQHMLPPFTPFHYGMYRSGKHYTKGRFFPTAFLDAALGALAASGTCIADATSMDAAALCSKVLELTEVDYDEIWTKEYERYAESHVLFANYDLADFSIAMPEEVPAAGAGAQAADALKATLPVPLAKVLAAVDGAAAAAPAPSPAEGGEVEAEETLPSRKEVDDADKMALQSYGRPYGDNGKPSGVYYSYSAAGPLETMPVFQAE